MSDLTFYEAKALKTMLNNHRQAYWTACRLADGERTVGERYSREAETQYDAALKRLADKFPFIRKPIKPEWHGTYKDRAYFVDKQMMFDIITGKEIAPAPTESTYIELLEHAGIA